MAKQTYKASGPEGPGPPRAKPKKTKGRPKHTNLVLPGEGKEAKTAPKADRLGRALPPEEAVSSPPDFKDPERARPEATGRMPAQSAAGSGGATGEIKKDTAAKPNKQYKDKTAGQKAQRLTAEDLPPNAILMPSKNPKVVALRRKRVAKRIGKLLVALAIPVLFLLFYGGYYQTLSMKAGELYESVRIAVAPGEGYPAPFQIAGFKKALPMGGGFSALGEKDLAIYSSTGKELQRIQHGYATPAMSASDTRVCVYPRGGKEYVVEGRLGRVAKRTTTEEILFAQMSPGGKLAVVTMSRHRSTVEVYGQQYSVGEPDFKWTLDKDVPLMASFHTDDKTFALGCVSAREGALGSTVYLLRTDRDKPQAQMREEDATVLQLHFFAANRLLAVYDRCAVLYNGSGEVLSRYEYGGRQLLCADAGNGKAALVFSEGPSGARMVVLDSGLRELFTAAAPDTANLQPLVTSGATLLLSGQEVAAYGAEGQTLYTEAFDNKVHALVGAKTPLALTAGMAYELATQARASGANPQPSTQGQSAGQALPADEPEPAGGPPSEATVSPSAALAPLVP